MQDETDLMGRQARDEDEGCGQQARQVLFDCNASQDVSHGVDISFAMPDCLPLFVVW